MFDASRFCGDYGINWEPASDPWIAVECPWCGSTSSKGHSKMYGGINTHSEAYNCFRCGGRRLTTYLRQVTGQDGEKLIWDYSSTAVWEDNRHKVKSVAMPGEPLLPAHRNYLASRGFDPDYMVETYGLRGTASNAFYTTTTKKVINLSWRIIVPIHDGMGRLVSWQSRDVTGHAKLRYIGCPDTDSLASYKTLLYGSHLVRNSNVVLVEGLFDMWRIGAGALCAFGTGVTPMQISALTKYGNVAIAFDSEKKAQEIGLDIAMSLNVLGTSAQVVDLELGERDAAEMTDAELQEMRKMLSL